MICKFISHIGPMIHPQLGSIACGQVFECPSDLYAHFEQNAPGKVVMASEAEQVAFMRAKRTKGAETLADDTQVLDNQEAETTAAPAPAGKRPGRPPAAKKAE